jgi:hypothetical protein
MLCPSSSYIYHRPCLEGVLSIIPFNWDFIVIVVLQGGELIQRLNARLNLKDQCGYFSLVLHL